MKPTGWIVIAVTALAWLLLAAPAGAASHASGLSLGISDPTGITDAIGGLIKKIGGVALGGLEWTTDVAGKFIINTLAGLVDLLIPDSWAKQGLAIMQWVVAAPNYGARVTSPDGSSGYAFAGINELRDLFVWLGLAILPLTLGYAGTRASFGQGDHVAAPIMRTLAIAVVLIAYTWLWGQMAALCNQITKAILGVPSITDGINALMEFIVGGAALGGLPLIGLLVMGAAGAALLALIFAKVLMILVGAIVYVTGPLMIGVAPTERGAAAARGWLTLAIGIFVLPMLWATVIAISALLVSDSNGAGAIIGTSSDLGKLLGGLVLALAGIAGLWLNLKLTKFAAAILGGQIAAMLALAGEGGRGSSGGGLTRRGPSHARDALNAFGNRPGSGATRAASSGRTSLALSATRGGGASLVRGGSATAKRGSGAAAPAAQSTGAAKAGAVATRMARAGRTGHTQPAAATTAPRVSTGPASPQARPPGGRAAPHRQPTAERPRADRDAPPTPTARTPGPPRNPTSAETPPSELRSDLPKPTTPSTQRTSRMPRRRKGT
jgi:hypothetical protein